MLTFTYPQIAVAITGGATEAEQIVQTAHLAAIEAATEATELASVAIQAATQDSAALLASLESKVATDAVLSQVLVELQAKADLAETQPVSLASVPLPIGAATQTTLAAILAKLIAAPSTEAKQDAANTSLTTLASKDFATQTTLAAVLAKLIAAPATEAKQDTGNTSLATLAGKDYATQTTLAAILAKLIAAPSTASNQSTIITSLAALLNELQGKANLTQTQPVALSGRNTAHAPQRRDYSTSSVTTSAYVTIVAALDNNVNELEIFDSSGQTLVLAIGAAAAEIPQVYIVPGGNGKISLFIPQGERVSIKAVSALANVGEIVINFLT